MSDPSVAVDQDADEMLLPLLRQGDARAFEMLICRNNRRLFRLARSIIGSDAEAEDVVQEAYVRAFVALDGFRGEASLRTWLARIVSNEALGRLRRRRPTVVYDGAANAPKAGFGAMITALTENPEHQVARREIRTLIEREVEALPAHFRVVFVMRVIEQMSIEETAACLDIPPETVKTRLFRANRLLRHALLTELDYVFDEAFPFAGARCDRMVANVLGSPPVAEHIRPIEAAQTE